MPNNHRGLESSLFPAEANRQNEFVNLLRLRLLAQPWLSALWLGGSGARDNADRWSSVDLHLLVTSPADISLLPERLGRLLDGVLPAGWTTFGLQQTVHTGSLEGLTYARLPGAADRGGVYFRLLWTEPDVLALHCASYGARRLLWMRADLPPAQRALLEMPGTRLEPAEAPAVQVGLISFWQQLAHLPAALNRQEHLAAVALLQQARIHLTNLVVALNGATRPNTPTRINSFLGPAQQDAFEKTLGQSDSLGESWIGQAVALIVLYRWYAPQLVEIHKLVYPTALEETVLALLSAEVSGWPARITTA
jgi:hypothetical protein